MQFAQRLRSGVLSSDIYLTLVYRSDHKLPWVKRWSKSAEAQHSSVHIK